MGYDVSQCSDPEQLFVIGEDGRRYHSPITEVLGVAMMIMGEYAITEKNWRKIAANLLIINRVYPPFNTVSIVRKVGEDKYEDIVLDWTHVKRYIGFRVAVPKADRTFLHRMQDAMLAEVVGAEKKTLQSSK